jgi:Protein of unknown function (DUF2877)
VAPVALPVVTIGWRAQAALAGQGELRPLGTLSASRYFTVGPELIWLGPVGASLHARAVLVDRLPDDLDTVVLDRAGARVWRPSPPVLQESPRSLVEDRCRWVMEALPVLGEARGFGALLVGGSLDDPLQRALGPARALARAFGENDPIAAAAAAEELIGLGPGLTPAGDDFVGGAFFARAMLPPAGARQADWTRAGDGLRAVAGSRTHPLSAALFSDLLAGEGYEPLHDLAAAVATGARPMALAAAGRLCRIGHSSGWDLLAGFLAGVLGLPAVGGIAAAPQSAREGWT